MTEENTSPQTPPQPTTTPPADIVARPGRYYRNARYIIFLLIVGSGAWFLYDGFVKWPKQNADALARELKLTPEEVGRMSANDVLKMATERGVKLPHPGHDVPWNRRLGIALPPLGIWFLVVILRKSRGQLRLAEDTLHIPGHPPIPLDAIRKIDKRKWERKGIAIIAYELTDGASGQFKLDDFVYDRTPTDAIFARIESHAKALTGEA